MLMKEAEVESFDGWKRCELKKQKITQRKEVEANPQLRYV